MELARFAVKAQATVVIYSVGRVRVLLNLGEQDALAYRVERAGLNKEEISLFDRDFLDIVGQRAVGYRLPELLAGYVLFKAEQKIGARFAVEDIPRLGLSRAAALFQAVGVVGVNLNRKSVLSVDKLY